MSDPIAPDVLAALLGLVAHDLRNPLSALQSNVGFLKSILPEDDQDASDALSDCQASCQSLVEIIDNLEILGHELRGTGRLELAPVAMQNLVEEVVQRLEPVARSHETRITLADEQPLPAVTVTAHREMLTRALSNLVQNAIQHGGRSGVRVSVGVAGGACTVRVEDAGAPVASELLDAAFSASGQLVAKSERGGRYGRGLGLFSAAVAARAAGAEVRASSTESGSLLELVVPVRDLAQG